MNIEKILEEAGLNDREVKVYLAALELGESTVLPIAKKSDIKRTYCYDILSDLQKRGLVSYFEKNNRRRYVAENPQKIADILKNRLDDFRAILPDLRAIYNNAPEKPKIRYFEGTEGIITLYNEVLKVKPKELLGISSPKKIEQTLGEFFGRYIQKTIEIRLHSRDIITHSDANSKHVFKHLDKDFQQLKILPRDIKMSTDTMIYNNTVIMISYAREGHAVLIESKEIAETQRMIFEVLWHISKPA